MASGATRLFESIRSAIFGTTPSISSPNTLLSRAEAMKTAREAAAETLDASRSGLLRRPTAGKADLAGAASEALRESGLSAATVRGIAAKAASREFDGGLAYRSTTGALAYAGKHPILTAGGLGAAWYAATDNTLESGPVGTGLEIAADGLGGVLGTLGSGITGGTNALGSIFGSAVDGLEYMGINPTAASIMVGLATFATLKTGLGMIAESTGISKYVPLVGGLGVILAAGILAFKIADAGNSAEPEVTEQNDKSALAIGTNAPAPAMP